MSIVGNEVALGCDMYELEWSSTMSFSMVIEGHRHQAMFCDEARRKMRVGDGEVWTRVA